MEDIASSIINKILIEFKKAGADFSLKNNDGKTALSTAIFSRIPYDLNAANRIKSLIKESKQQGTLDQELICNKNKRGKRLYCFLLSNEKLYEIFSKEMKESEIENLLSYVDDETLQNIAIQRIFTE